jgi:hypothetical protein
MSEAGGSNLEIAKHLSEHKGSSRSLGHELLEIAEAVVLAVVAIATAWSGYQAALWTGTEAELKRATAGTNSLDRKSLETASFHSGCLVGTNTGI